MNPNLRAFLTVCLLSTAGGGAVSCRSVMPGTKVNEAEAFFQSEVKPILEMNCLACHHGGPPPERLNLTSRESTLAGRSKSGRPYLTPGRPEESLLLTAVSRLGTHPKLMPQRDLSLTEEDIGTLTEWITDGAVWPAGPSGTLSPKPNPETP